MLDTCCTNLVCQGWPRTYLLIFHSTRAPHTFIFFFFNDTATTEIYTLSLHDALPISIGLMLVAPHFREDVLFRAAHTYQDRKSTRLNSSHSQISYAVFCLKKKKYSHTNARPRLASLQSRPPGSR